MYHLLIKRHRHRKRITQQELAEKAGISKSYLSHLEKEGVSRDRTPTLQALEAVCTVLQICPRHVGFFPCIECPYSLTCKLKDKDMRPVKEIADEILSYYDYV